MSNFSSNNSIFSDSCLNSTEEIERMMLHLANKSDIDKIKLILSNNDQPINILSIKDKRGYTLLHFAALNNDFELMQLYINYVKTVLEIDKSEEFNKWIDFQVYDEQFTALHLASFKGNLSIIEILLENGSDINKKNKELLNCLHLASQGDQPRSLIFFKEKGLDLNSLDSKGSTPLHWAAFLGCENSINYLTLWQVLLDLKDGEEGLTPLHLAVMAGNSRIVRKLLLKGAKKNIKDKNGKIPLDYAKEHLFNNVADMLENNYSCLNYYNIKPILSEDRNKKTSLISFILMLIFINFFLIISIYPYCENYIWFYVDFSLIGLVFFFFLKSWLMNPGYLINGEKKLSELVKNHDSSMICQECSIIKVYRSKHCEICNKCVNIFDHHCPWINNCVGARNHSWFLCYIISLWSLLLFTIIFSSYFLTSYDIINDYWDNYITLSDEQVFIIKICILIIAIFICLMFFFPLNVLAYVQITNFLLNKTTAERYNKKNKNQEEKIINSDETNPSLLVGLNDIKVKSKISILKSKQNYLNNCYLMCYANSKSSRE